MKQLLFSRIFVLVVGFFLVMSCSDDDVAPEPIDNEYALEGVVYEIQTKMYWEQQSAQGAVDQIRLLEPLIETELFDMIIISPVKGPSSLEGTYVYSQTGDIGTYDLKFVHATDGIDDLAWYTNGDNGGALEIELMSNNSGRPIYRILIPQFSLNYGYWDYLAGKWISLGQKSFTLSYEGVIDGD